MECLGVYPQKVTFFRLSICECLLSHLYGRRTGRGKWDPCFLLGTQVALAMKAAREEPAVHQELASDPPVQVLVLRAAMSTAKCRSHGEQFPKIVKDRQQSPLIQSLETSWSVCDLEDVVLARPDRTHFQELEACQLRHAQGIYGQKDDDLHFRKDIAVAAGDELLKAVRRSAIRKCLNFN